MTSFWDDRPLSKSSENDLTTAIVDALRTDSQFRAAYEHIVLAPLSSVTAPRITAVSPQPTFPGQGSRPDMLLVLEDGRQIVCEHKIRAPETVSASAEGQLIRQIERYLELPAVAAVAYFRPTWREPADAILFHPRYLHPAGAPNFLWRHLFAPLDAGTEPVTAWLREGFERLGFTPALPHAGTLVEQADKENFGKLWDALANHLFEGWRREHGTHSTLYLYPRAPSAIDNIFLDARVRDRGDPRLRIRVRVRDDCVATSFTDVRQRLGAVAADLPVPAEARIPGLSSGHAVIDLLAPLKAVLGSESDAAAQEAGLQAEVGPVADALATGA